MCSVRFIPATSLTSSVDHFNVGSNQTFEQRFWYSSEFFDLKKGPIFLYICGEYECSVRQDRMFPFEVAKEHNAMFLYLEHRYYGASQPFDTHSVENLRFLTSRHALADLAVFLTEVNSKVVQNFGGEMRKVIVVGGSYPGAMAAWFKAKYPHVADAAWASSAVVNAVEDFDMFDYQIYNSTMRSSESCTNTIQSMTKAFDSAVENNDLPTLKEIKKYFEAQNLENGDFAFFLADLFVGPIQYGNRTELCTFVESIANLEIMQKFQKTAEYTAGSHSVGSYNRYILKDETIVTSKSSRQWTYQY